ncbi:MAG: nitroreductase [Lachnospiraceae bacterium]|nr:nitroreductase [Lachnospiraceae bacterium]
MNQTIETILKRRSTRSFTEEPLQEADLKVLAECAVHAPSGMGKQTWKFTVVTNQALIQKLAAAVGKELGREGYDMYAPAALIIPSNLKSSPWGMEDDACAMENIFLAAESLGIGSVWINQLRTICDVPEIRAILEELHIPDDHTVYGLAALGYRDDTPIPPKERIGVVEFIR